MITNLSIILYNKLIISDKNVDNINTRGTILKYPWMFKRFIFLKQCKYKNLSTIAEVKYIPSDSSDIVVIIFFIFVFNFSKFKFKININVKLEVKILKILPQLLCVPQTNIFPFETNMFINVDKIRHNINNNMFLYFSMFILYSLK